MVPFSGPLYKERLSFLSHVPILTHGQYFNQGIYISPGEFAISAIYSLQGNEASGHAFWRLPAGVNNLQPAARYLTDFFNICYSAGLFEPTAPQAVSCGAPFGMIK